MICPHCGFAIPGPRPPVRKRKRTCPKCGSEEVGPIVYGLPDLTPENRARLDRQKAVLGGCLMEEGQPTRYCHHCGHKWGRTGPC